MALTPKDTYACLALEQIPRLLGNQDRNPFSPTYGCFHRDYWLDKTSDFPDAVRQFGVHALALVYRHEFPGNIYKGKSKIRDWTVAALDYWASIQHGDGSFDEFYPYERGWAGPTAFTTYTVVEALSLLGEDVPSETAERVRLAVRRAAYFIAQGQQEEDHLANHHAVACLAVWKAYRLLNDPTLKVGYDRLWDGFRGYHNSTEGWSREYDGVDPGYLSATVSFLSKIYKENSDPEILDVLRQSIHYCAYFVYPNGFYAGSLGSRNTLHFYPHGFEIMGDQLPMAAAVSEAMLSALADGKLVPPGIISDRYVFYRVPELLQSFQDYTRRPDKIPLLPYQQPSFCQYFPESRIYARATKHFYLIANLAKGGVVKVFDRQNGGLLLNDCGLIGRLSDGRVATTQWVDPKYSCQVDEQGWQVRGHMHVVPSNKLFTPLKNIVFRIALVALGWHPAFAHFLKGRIRKALMLGLWPIPVSFIRRLRLENGDLLLSDEVTLEAGVQFSSLSVGDEFAVRYVPQSRYFQSQELEIRGRVLDPSELSTLNRRRHLRLECEIKA